MTGQGAEQESSLETGTESEDMQLNMGGAQACVGTLLEKCPTDKTDACKTQDAGTCVNVFHKCTSDKMVQCAAWRALELLCLAVLCTFYFARNLANHKCKAVRKGKCASGGATCYLPCTGVELHGSSCAAQPVDNCNGGYITDGSSGMSCMVSTQAPRQAAVRCACGCFTRGLDFGLGPAVDMPRNHVVSYAWGIVPVVRQMLTFLQLTRLKPKHRNWDC